MTQTILGVILGSSVVSLLLSRFFERGDEKRQNRQAIYSEAVRVLIEKREFPYRVKRRANNQAAAVKLVEEFHESHKVLPITYTRVASDSIFLSKELRKIDLKMKESYGNACRDAWNSSINPSVSLSNWSGPITIEDELLRFSYLSGYRYGPWRLVPIRILAKLHDRKKRIN